MLCRTSARVEASFTWMEAKLFEWTAIFCQVQSKNIFTLHTCVWVCISVHLYVCMSSINYILCICQKVRTGAQETDVRIWLSLEIQLTIQHLPQHHQGRARSDRFLEFALGWVQATVRARTTSSMSDDGWKHFLAPGPTPSLYLQSCQVEFGQWFISVKFQSPQLLASHFGKSYNYISVESLAKRFLSNLDILFLKRP